MDWIRCGSHCARIDSYIDKGCTILIVVGGAAIALTVVLQVLLRYVFKAPLFGLEEFSRLIAVWVYFLGAIFGTKLDSHVQGDVVERMFNTARGKALVKTITWFLSFIVCLLFLYHSAKYCFWLYGTGEKTTGLWWPRITSVGSMFFGAIFMTFYSAVNVLKYFDSATSKPNRGPGGAE